eukprot:10715021-Prorocentrum_lima.AAC.1
MSDPLATLLVAQSSSLSVLLDGGPLLQQAGVPDSIIHLLRVWHEQVVIHMPSSTDCSCSGRS